LIEKQKQYQTNIIKAIVESQENERDAVGKELHDRIGANIAVIKQHTDKTNKSLTNLVNQTIEAVRDLSHTLVTPSISDNDFIDEINELCFLFSNIDIKINSSFYNWKGIHSETRATHLYRIIQELLQNAVKHSKAQNVFIQFIVDDEKKLTVMYEDDGIGFDYDAVYKKQGLGLINISNRIKLMDATIAYDTQENRKGTTITIEMLLV
jgi:signal transduction histidine kinase